VGKIVQANGGTLFLDEIGDMPVALQAHLLRVLQERQVTPLGSAKSVAVDVSIICATHRNLREMIDRKVFREDLFYRLNGLAVRLPPLRERSDLLALVRRILDQLTEHDRKQRHLQPDADVLKLFQHYQWPGNVRQLFNVLRTAAVMAAGEAVITREHLSDDFLEEARAALANGAALASGAAAVGWATPGAAATGAAASGLVAAGVAPAPGSGPASGPATGPGPQHLGAGSHAPLAGPASLQAPAPAAPHTGPAWSVEPTATPRSLEEMGIDAIRHAVAAAGGNISEASKQLGISRNTIYRKLRWNKPG
jgi:transcriptional regulator of acetoin/glycerol metabolism